MRKSDRVKVNIAPGKDDEAADKFRLAHEAARALLVAAGEDPNREGLQETPRRFAEAWLEWNSGYNVDVQKLLKTFKDGGEQYNQLVGQQNITLWSRCEHHLAPFWGVAHVAYIPNKSIVGLSKMARLVEAYASRLQVQERLTAQIADALWSHLKPKAVGVMLICRHTCIESRGIKKHKSQTTTTALHGAFLKEPAAKSEFLDFCRAPQKV